MAKRVLIFSIFERVMYNDPNGSRKDQFKAFLKNIRESDDLLEQLAETYFESQYRQWKMKYEGGRAQLVGTPATERRVADAAAKRAESIARNEAAKEKMKAEVRVVLLDLTTPNGKKLRFCTGAELAKFGGFYAELSNHIGATEIVDKHLSEQDLRNVWTRYEKPVRRRASGRAESRIGA